jgi:predicted GIY-YIG superfamily endonuclease
MSQLYVLELEDNKWYVGKTDDIHKRFDQHKTGKGSEWTKEYKPIKIHETRKITSVHDETNVTKDLMKKYGVDNVRGGAYCQVQLPEYLEETIRHELKSSGDKCYNCGKKGHFANRCPNNQEESEEEVVYYTPKKQSGVCYRCGRKGHYSPDCYARTNVDGDYLSDDSD